MHGRPSILVVVGTRPEALKLAPVVEALRAVGHRVRVLATGQHPGLATAALAEAGITVDVVLPEPSRDDLARLTADIMVGVASVIARLRPALVIVQGDTTSALAGALAAFHAGVPLAHVEAGLRTGDLGEPFPEEGHRAMIARIASLHLAPTRGAVRHLKAERAPGVIRQVGNTSIDALDAALARLACPARMAELEARFPFVAEPGPPLVLATVHRRENRGPRLAAIAEGLARVAATGRVRLVVPLHPNPHATAQLERRLRNVRCVHLLPPLAHLELLWLLQRSALLLTDLGGLQEEAPALGVRTLVLRERTERREGVLAGVARLVPLRPHAIAEAVAAALAEPPPAPRRLYGDGRAAPRIARAVSDFLGVKVPQARIPALERTPPALP